MENEVKYPKLEMMVAGAERNLLVRIGKMPDIRAELAAAERCAANLERWTEEGRQGLAVRDSEIARLYADLEAARSRIQAAIRVLDDLDNDDLDCLGRILSVRHILE